MIQPSFIHLRLHSEFSIRDSLIPLKALAQRVADQSMPAVALTDFCNLFGAVKFYSAMRSKGIKPLMGADVMIQSQQGCYPVTLLCQNATGYRHLTQLISEAYLHGQDKDAQPRIDWSWLVEKNQGLIALSGGLQGDIAQAILRDDTALAQQRCQTWLHVFGDRFYIEISRLGFANEERYINEVSLW